MCIIITIYRSTIILTVSVGEKLTSETKNVSIERPLSRSKDSLENIVRQISSGSVVVYIII